MLNEDANHIFHFLLQVGTENFLSVQVAEMRKCTLPSYLTAKAARKRAT